MRKCQLCVCHTCIPITCAEFINILIIQTLHFNFPVFPDLPALKGSNTNTSRYEQLALNSEVKCALSHTPNIRFSNMEPSFPDCSCPAKDFAIGKETKLLWYLYLLCGHRGILEEVCLKNPRGMDLLVDGSILPSSIEP